MAISKYPQDAADVSMTLIAQSPDTAYRCSVSMKAGNYSVSTRADSRVYVAFIGESGNLVDGVETVNGYGVARLTEPVTSLRWMSLGSAVGGLRIAIEFTGSQFAPDPSTGGTLETITSSGTYVSPNPGSALALAIGGGAAGVGSGPGGGAGYADVGWVDLPASGIAVTLGAGGTSPGGAGGTTSIGTLSAAGGGSPGLAGDGGSGGGSGTHGPTAFNRGGSGGSPAIGGGSGSGQPIGNIFVAPGSGGANRGAGGGVYAGGAGGGTQTLGPAGIPNGTATYGGGGGGGGVAGSSATPTPFGNSNAGAGGAGRVFLLRWPA